MKIMVKELKALIREAIEEVMNEKGWEEESMHQEAWEEGIHECDECDESEPCDECEEYLSEGKKKPSAGLSKKQKSAISKKAHAGGDIGKKGKGFKALAAKAAKKYGSKEKGRKVAAAAMWAHAKR